MNEELRDEVAGVLGEHKLHPSLNICTTAPGLERGPCDWRPVEGAGSLQAQHRNHQADALMPLLERREREAAARAWDEGHRAGIEHQRTDGQFIRFVETNPYRTDASTEETP